MFLKQAAELGKEQSPQREILYSGLKFSRGCSILDKNTMLGRKGILHAFLSFLSYFFQLLSTIDMTKS